MQITNISFTSRRPTVQFGHDEFIFSANIEDTENPLESALKLKSIAYNALSGKASKVTTTTTPTTVIAGEDVNKAMETLANKTDGANPPVIKEGKTPVKEKSESAKKAAATRAKNKAIKDAAKEAAEKTYTVEEVTAELRETATKLASPQKVVAIIKDVSGVEKMKDVDPKFYGAIVAACVEARSV